MAMDGLSIEDLRVLFIYLIKLFLALHSYWLIEFKNIIFFLKINENLK